MVASQFVNNGDGTVIDQRTGLIWCQQETSEMTWEEALTFCENYSFANHNDWRLPNIKELRSISNDQISNSSVNTTYFPSALVNSYWSSTTEIRHADQAWFVNFENGLISHKIKTIKHYVRCVRGGTGTQTEVGENLETVPLEFELYQNYPNPFNPNTTISFSLPEANHVSLKIYDLLGKEVASLIDGYVSSGTHSIQWQAENLPSGIYFYKLSSGSFSETKRMLLLR